VDFQIFRAELSAVLAYSDGSSPTTFVPSTMYKAHVIHAANNLSRERAEFLIKNRLSFGGFLIWASRSVCLTRA
jgi:transposase, IS5 family